MTTDGGSSGEGGEGGGRGSRSAPAPSAPPGEAAPPATPSGPPGAGLPGAPRSPTPHRVTLQFAGPPLVLPDEPEPDATAFPDREAPSEEMPLKLDTGEFVLDQVHAKRIEDKGTGTLKLDLDELETKEESPESDGWTRLRESTAPAAAVSAASAASEAPARPRSVTPPAMGRDDALDLVSKRSRPPSTPGLDLGSEMADRYALGDYTGALRVAELVLGKEPNDVAAQRCAESSRERLMQLYTARLASICGTTGDLIGMKAPRVAVPEHEIRWLGLDHRQGFLLSRLDGDATIEDLVDLTAMTRLEVLRTLVELVEARAVTFG